MKLEEAIKGLEGMIKCGGICEGGFKDDEKEILERILHYIKEESIPRAVIEKELDYQNMLWNTANRQKEYNQELSDFLQEILNKGEK